MRKASTKTHLFWKVPSTRTAVLCGLTLLTFSGCGRALCVDCGEPGRFRRCNCR